jgi:hypothetical protein
MASLTDNSHQEPVTPYSNDNSNFLRHQTVNNFDDLNDDELFVLVSLATRTLR